MDSWSIFVGLLLSLVLMQFLTNKSKTRKLPPGPTSLPIIGNLHQIGQNPNQSLASLAKIYGPIMSVQFGQLTTVVISSSLLAKEVLQKQDLAFSSRNVPDALNAHNHHLYSLAMLPLGATWRSLRRIMATSIFSSKGLSTSNHLRSKKVHELITYCRNSCKDGRAVDISQAAFVTTLNIISNTIFSKDLAEPNQDSVNELKKILLDINVEVGKPNLADYFQMLKKMDPQRIRQRVSVYTEMFLKLVGGLINERLDLRKVHTTSANTDFLDLCLAISEQNPQEINRDLILRLCMDLLIAAVDTTSSTLEWAMAEIVRHTEIMMNAKVELNKVTGNGKILEDADISRLPYLQCIVKETMRLHPPLPFLLPRKVESDVKVNGYIIPSGSQVLVNAWAIGRDETEWEDSLTFKPERFFTVERDFKGNDFELIPFGAGRRICPGWPMAMKIIPLMLGSLINSFDWKLEGGIEVKELDMTEKLGFTIQKALPLCVMPMPLTTQ